MTKNFKIFIMMAFFATTSGANATIITVDNKPNSAADYSDLQTAIDAASAGDTLYISGSPTSYGDITITKKIALIGAGYMVDNQWGLTTTLENIYLNVGMDEFNNPIDNLSGSFITGFYIKFSFYINENVQDIIINRCFLDNGFVFYENTQAYITNSIFGGYSITSYNALVDITILNSIIKSGSVVGTSSSAEIIVDHCIFLGSASLNLSYGIISNSIFYNASTGGAQFCSFSNNISGGGEETDFIYGTNSGGGNFANTNPLFSLINSVDFNVFDNYNLQSESVGKNAATDGTDIGIHGGQYPFPSGGENNYRYAPTPEIPQIYEMNILNSSVSENGTLNVNIKARKSN